ncbi:MAG: deoxyhypusine synthase [candidate division Zixibacteria bacterium]|nr:deoxyhypusine synthase [candidate division Zixibacteria bacterium]
MNEFLKNPTRPLEIENIKDVAQLLEKMSGISFQGRNLSTALGVWKEMLKKNVVIFLGLSGAMIPGGLRQILVYLIKNRLIDCLVSTGANLFHDLHESLGKYHYLGDHLTSDLKLRKAGIDRIYDTFALEEEFRETDEYIKEFTRSFFDLEKSYSTREFFYSLGKVLSRMKKKEGMVSSAYASGIPIFCPAIGDSSYGIALVELGRETGKRFQFDVIQDAEEISNLVLWAKSTGVIYIGGGTPKNFIQQAEVIASLQRESNKCGHEYAIQIVVDSPHWGGLSGCTFAEAQSWGKIHPKAKTVTVHSDATIALPFLVGALSQGSKGLIRKRKKPEFKFGKELSLKR